MSRSLTPLRVETGAWLLLFAGLFAGIGVVVEGEDRWNSPLVRGEMASAVFAKPELKESFLLPPPDNFMEIALRPLFVVTRRPAPIPAPPEPPKPGMRKGQFVLTGTTIVGNGRFAHFLEKTSKKSRVVAEGKEIEGILVKEVKPEWVILTQHDDVETLTLSTMKAPKPSAEPQVAAEATTPSGSGRRRFVEPQEAGSASSATSSPIKANSGAKQ